MSRFTGPSFQPPALGAGSSEAPISGPRVSMGTITVQRASAELAVTRCTPSPVIRRPPAGTAWNAPPSTLTCRPCWAKVTVTPSAARYQPESVRVSWGESVASSEQSSAGAARKLLVLLTV